jgi:hypothetical protein
MENYLLMVQVNCTDPLREKEFNQWYDEIHLPDMLKVPGLIKAIRYLNLNPETNKRPIFFILYEIETEYITQFEKSYDECVQKAQNTSRMIDILATEVYLGLLIINKSPVIRN